MKLFKLLLFITFVICLIPSVCQANGQVFVETIPPKGVVTGYIQARGRYGALIKGGQAVYPDDLFSVTRDGYETTWKVLELTADKHRFAKGTSVKIAENPKPPDQPDVDTAPNFKDLVIMLEKEAVAYKAETTKVRKEEVVRQACRKAAEWVAKNTTVSVRGKLKDIAMISSNTARIRLDCVDTGTYALKKNKCLYVHSLYQVDIPLSREQALKINAGDAVTLTGTPVFKAGTGNMVTDVLLSGKPPFTQFRMLNDSLLIGIFDIKNPECKFVKAQ